MEGRAEALCPRSEGPEARHSDALCSLPRVFPMREVGGGSTPVSSRWSRGRSS